MKIKIETIKPCPFCGAIAFEEIFGDKECEFARINHKTSCYLNRNGQAFERFALKDTIKTADWEFSASEELERWNKRG